MPLSQLGLERAYDYAEGVPRGAAEAYLATVDVPRGVELMRKAGAEPEWRVVDVLELG